MSTRIIAVVTLTGLLVSARAASAGSLMLQPLVRMQGTELIPAFRVRALHDVESHVSFGLELQGDIGTRTTYSPVIALAARETVIPWPTGTVTRSFSAGPVLRLRSRTPGPFVVAGYMAQTDRVSTHFTDGTASGAWRNGGAGVTVGGGISLGSELRPTIEIGHHTNSQVPGYSYFSLGLSWR